MARVNVNTVEPYRLGNGLTLIGGSIAAQETSFCIPEKRFFFDAGSREIVEREANHVFLTHGHGDHSGMLHKLLVANGSRKPNIYVHNSTESDVREFIHAAFKLSTTNPRPKIHNKYTLIPVSYGQQFEIKMGGKEKWLVDTIYCKHTVPCVGYGFTDVRTKLKDEYAQYDGQDLGRLKREGVEITERKEVPLFCYLGDTNHDIFNDNDERNRHTYETIMKFPIIIVECTFLYDEHIKHAKKDRHMHWIYLYEIVKRYPDKKFILIHFSKRYMPFSVNGNLVRKFFKPFTTKYNENGTINESYCGNIHLWIPKQKRYRDVGMLTDESGDTLIKTAKCADNDNILMYICMFILLCVLIMFYVYIKKLIF